MLDRDAPLGSYRKQLHEFGSTGSSYMNPQEIAFGSYRKQLHEELGSCMNSAVTGSSCRKQFAGKMAHVLRAVKAVCTCSRGEIK